MGVALSVVLAASRVEITTSQDCDFDVSILERLAGIELARGPAGVRVLAQLMCVDGAVEVRIDDPVTNKALARRTPLSVLPQNTRERFLALVIAELVEASWSELLLPAPRTQSSVAPSVLREAKTALPTRGVRLLAHAAMRSFVTRRVMLGGGGLKVHVSVLGALGVAAALDAEHGEVVVTAGRVGVDSFSGAGFATLAGDWAMLRFTTGLGMRAGWARLVGSPEDHQRFRGDTISGVLAGPAVFAEASLPIELPIARVELSLSGEAGVAIWRLEGLLAGEPATGLTGPWLSGFLSIGVRL